MPQIDLDTLRAMIDGLYGEEAEALGLELLDQAEAEAAGFEAGFEDEDDYYDPEDEDAYIEGQMVAGIEDELAKLEGKLGRRLSQREERAILHTISSDDWHRGVVPDLSEHAAKMKARVTGSREDRVNAMAAAADAAKEQAVEDEPEPEADWMQPDTTSDAAPEGE